MQSIGQRSAGQAQGMRRRLVGPEILVAIGGHDPFSALVAANAGAEAFYLGGYSVAAHLHGLPDIGLIGLSDVLEVLERITAVTSIPVFVDADTGYGSEPGVRRTVQLLERAGAAGIQIEDQVSPKRCAYMDGIRVIPQPEMIGKIHAAIDARGSEDTILIARTDALAANGLDDAVDRANNYAAAGADLVVVEAERSRDEAEELAARIDAPKAAILPATGKLLLSIEELQQRGYRLAVFPSPLGTWLFAQVYGRLCREIVRTGTTGDLLRGFDDIEELHAITDAAGWQAASAGANRPVLGVRQ